MSGAATSDGVTSDGASSGGTTSGRVHFVPAKQRSAALCRSAAWWSYMPGLWFFTGYPRPNAYLCPHAFLCPNGYVCRILCTD